MKTIFLYAVLCVTSMSASEISLDSLTHWAWKRPVYSGPSTLRGWKQYDEPVRDWRLSAHALHTNSAHWIGLEVPMHGTNLISFDLRWQEPLRFALSVFLNNYRTDRKNTYFTFFLWGDDIWAEISRSDERVDNDRKSLGETTSSVLISRSDAMWISSLTARTVRSRYGSIENSLPVRAPTTELPLVRASHFTRLAVSEMFLSAKFVLPGCWILHCLDSPMERNSSSLTRRMAFMLHPSNQFGSGRSGAGTFAL